MERVIKFLEEKDAECKLGIIYQESYLMDNMGCIKLKHAEDIHKYIISQRELRSEILRAIRILGLEE